MSHSIAPTPITASNGRPRFAGWLIAGVSLLAVLMMAHHPTVASHDIADAAAELIRITALNRLVHGSLIVMTVLLLFGFSELSSWLTSRTPRLGPWIRAALLAYAVGTFAMIVAAIFSGFVSTELAAHYAGADAAGMEALRLSLTSSHAVNQAFAAIGVVARCVAILLWSIALLRGTQQWLIGVLGLVAIAPAIALLLGLLHLDVHGAMLALLGEVIWNLAVATQLLRGKLQ